LRWNRNIGERIAGADRPRGAMKGGGRGRGIVMVAATITMHMLGHDPGHGTGTIVAGIAAAMMIVVVVVLARAKTSGGTTARART